MKTRNDLCGKIATDPYGRVGLIQRVHGDCYTGINVDTLEFWAAVDAILLPEEEQYPILEKLRFDLQRARIRT